MSEKEYIFVGNAQLKTRDYIKQLEKDNIEKDNEIERLKKEKKELKDGWQEEVYSKNEVLNDWFECKGIIDKAIEYIENSMSGSWSLNEEYEVVSMNKKQILSILKGEDKE